MKKTIFLLIIIFTSTLSAQVLNIAEGNSVNISSEATLDIAGLELTPNADYSIVGENSVSKESDVITINGNESMSKNYMAGVSLEGYTGSVIFNYSDEEMNGVSHAASLYVMNSNLEWVLYEDEDNEDYTISHAFTDPLEMKAVTAGVTSYNVTFSVNTANITVGENGMYAGGGVLGGANAYPMSDDDGDGTWTVTIALNEGTTGNYIFLNSPNSDSDWGTKENLEGQECADPNNYNDRILEAVTGDTTLLHCFGSCETDGSCPSNFFDVTFSVNTANITVGENGMYAGGGVLGDATAYAMSDEDGDGTWTVTVSLLDGTSGNYTFLNSPNDGGDWGAKENLTGQECADADNYNDRILAEVTADTTLLHCFGSCETDGSCPSEFFDVTS
jgi:hypothetical protein